MKCQSYSGWSERVLFTLSCCFPHSSSSKKTVPVPFLHAIDRDAKHVCGQGSGEPYPGSTYKSDPFDMVFRVWIGHRAQPMLSCQEWSSELHFVLDG